jgi:ribosomal protein L37E
MGRKKKPIVEKECPRCGTIHIKKGLYCSYSCANVREYSDQDKQNKSDSVKRYYKSEEAETHKWKLHYMGKAVQELRQGKEYVYYEEEDMGSPLPPMPDEAELSMRKIDGDLWFDVD